MFNKNVLAVSGALLSVVAAVPLANKRDVVWVTETHADVVTVPMTTTVWVNAGDSIPAATSTPHSHYGHHQHGHSSQAASSEAAPASYETPSSSSSVYVAPTSSSSSVYVAPTSSSVYVPPTTSSVYVAPTTSSVYVAPTTSSVPAYVAPTSTYVASSSSAAAPAAYSSASSGGSSSGSGSEVSSGPGASGKSYSGDLTWYQVGMGACGETSSSSDKIVAIAESIFDSYNDESGGNPNNNPMCGKTVSITGKDGSEHQATVVDRCTGCKESDLDLSQDFFNLVTDNGDGRVSNMEWKFN